MRPRAGIGKVRLPRGAFCMEEISAGGRTGMLLPAAGFFSALRNMIE